MKTFELTYLCVKPFLPPLHGRVRSRLLKLSKAHTVKPHVLDVGGRKSHYTIGVPAQITVTDLPRESETQKILGLGINEKIMAETRRRRSNVGQVLFDDMTRSQLQDSSFDYVIAIEVLEHVEQDDKFVEEVYRVLKPGGVFLMSTPNGDFVKNTNPDHKRHYTREQLHILLRSTFEGVEVGYAVKGGPFRKAGLKSWSLQHPLQTIWSMISNLVNSIESAPTSLKSQAHGTHHLIAEAKKGE